MKKLSIIFVLMLQSFSALSWWDAGHMLVANIAYHHLNDNAKKEIGHLLPLMRNENTQWHQYDYPDNRLNYGMMYVSVWPDHIYAKPNYLYTTFPWHFISEPYSNDGTPPSYPIPQQNVVWALKNLIRGLKHKEANPYLRARTLSMIIHFTGDIHQPLHNITFYNQKIPKGDKGGNLYKINYKEPNGQVLQNLHKLWDSALNLYYEFGFSHEVHAIEDIEEITHLICRDYPPNYFGDAINIQDPLKWHKEGYAIAKEAYMTPYGSKPSNEYIKRNTRMVEQRIALAGYRLARLLNDVFSTR